MAQRIEQPIVLTAEELETVLAALSTARTYYGGRSKSAAVAAYARGKVEEIATVAAALVARRYRWEETAAEKWARSTDPVATAAGIFFERQAAARKAEED